MCIYINIYKTRKWNLRIRIHFIFIQYKILICNNIFYLLEKMTCYKKICLWCTILDITLGNIFVVVICDLDEKMHLLVVGDIKY